MHVTRRALKAMISSCDVCCILFGGSDIRIQECIYKFISCTSLVALRFFIVIDSLYKTDQVRFGPRVRYGVVRTKIKFIR